MAQLRIYQDMTGRYWPDWITGGVEVTRSDSLYKYRSDLGLTVTLTGSGFVYDAAGKPVEGLVTGLALQDPGDVLLLDVITASAGLGQLARAIFGYERGGLAAVPPLGEAVFQILLRGNDKIIGAPSDDLLLGDGSGGAGNDLINAGKGDDQVLGDMGRDTLFGGDGRDTLSYLHSADDPLAFRGVEVDVVGETAADVWGFVDRITGFEVFVDSAFGDRFLGSGTDESFFLTRGIDTVDGGAGRDTVSYALADRLGIGAGIVADLSTGRVRDPWGQIDRLTHVEGLVGSAWNDRLKGDSGDNSFEGLAGKDTFEGGLGLDRLLFTQVADLGGHGVVIDATLERAQIRDDGFGNVESFSGIEAFDLSGLNDMFNGGAGADTVRGGAGDDTLYGNRADDDLQGGAGNDALYGGGGSNRLAGGLGSDRLNGGGGADDFIFRDLGPENRDVIHAFNRAQGDQIWIASAWGGLTPGALAAEAFASGAGLTQAQDPATRVIYDSSTGLLRFDADGSGEAAAAVFALVANKTALGFAQFQVLE